MTSSSVKTLTLISNDGNEFVLSIEAAKQSELIKNIVDDIDDDLSSRIPLSQVNSATLAKVTEYLEKHVDHEVMKEELNKWDSDFLKVSNEMLFAIIIAANYMDIKSLLDSSCQAVADMIKGKTTEQIRQTFNIVNDFTPEEEELIRKENQWAFES